MEAKFGPLSPKVTQQVEALSPEVLAQLQLDLLNAQTLENSAWTTESHEWTRCACPFMNNIYDLARASPQLKADPAFHDLSTLFDDTEVLVFIAYCHTTEAANEQIARAMAASVVKTLSSRADSRKPTGADRGSGPK